MTTMMLILLGAMLALLLFVLFLISLRWWVQRFVR